MSASVHNVPQFHGVEADYPTWRYKVLSRVSISNRRPRSRCTAGYSNPSWRREGSAQRAATTTLHTWSRRGDTRVGSIGGRGCLRPSTKKIPKPGSPNSSWKIIEERFEPRGAAPNISGLTSLRPCGCRRGKVPGCGLDAQTMSGRCLHASTSTKPR